jgi:hypothetical protein
MKNQENPILDFQENQSNMPLAVILNKSLFEKFFDCDNYLDTLHSSYPFLKKVVKKDNNLYCLTDDSTLWLDVKVGENREFLPFHIYWQAHIPTMEDVALLMPISVFNTLTTGSGSIYLALGYDPLFPDSKGIRVKVVKELGESNYLERLKQECFPTANISEKFLTLNNAIPEIWFKQCITMLNIPLFDTNGDSYETPSSYVQIVEAPSSQYSFHYSNDGFLTNYCNTCRKPCEERIKNTSEHFRRVSSCVGEDLKIDAIRAIGGYGRAFVYASNRTLLYQEIEKIKNYPHNQSEKHFHIPKNYEDALVRFTFIDKIMVLFKHHYAWLFLVFLTVLLFVQVGIVITHRKHNYGIYLSKGIKLLTIYRIILLQVTLSFLVASSIVAPLVINLLQSLLADGVQKITTVEPYASHISASSLNLLPISTWGYITIAFVFLVVLYLTTISLLHLTIAKEHSEPAHLL